MTKVYRLYVDSECVKTCGSNMEALFAMDEWFAAGYTSERCEIRAEEEINTAETSRDEMMSELMKMACELVDVNYTGDNYKKIFDLAYEWNRNHANETEIIVSDIYKEDGYENDGIAIEDDYFLYNS